MKFGIREIIFVIVMLGLLGSTNYFVFSKANKKKLDLLADIHSKQQALSIFSFAGRLRCTYIGAGRLGRGTSCRA